MSFTVDVQKAITELHKIYNIISNTTYSITVIKSHDTVLLARPTLPLSIRLLHTILAGGHFPPKVNEDFCLAFYINPSSMF